MDKHFIDQVEKICEKDTRYPADAYVFVTEALHFTQRRLKAPHHISGEQLLSGVKDLTVRRFGPLALNVMEHWGIKSTEDIGNIVFNMVAARVLSKQDNDSIDSFRNAYDLAETFRKGYRRQLEREIGRIR